MSWLATALKIMPWGDVIEYAPKLVGGAQTLWQRMRSQNKKDMVIAEQATAPTLDAVAKELQDARAQLQAMQAQQLELSKLVSELATQNQSLVSAVDVLQKRIALLVAIIVVLAVAMIYGFAIR